MTRKELAGAIYDMECEYLGIDWSMRSKSFHIKAKLNGLGNMKPKKKAELQARYDDLVGMGYASAIRA